MRITAEFTDKEGGTFEDVYFSEEFENKTKELQQQAQAAMKKAMDEGYSE
ncbi:hypothetical protein [Rodentibacter genomosp. 2]